MVHIWMVVITKSYTPIKQKLISNNFPCLFLVIRLYIYCVLHDQQSNNIWMLNVVEICLDIIITEFNIEAGRTHMA